MASRLTTIIRWYQEIAGSTPAVVIFLFISYLFAIFFLSWDRTTYSMPCLFQIGSIKFDNTLVSGRDRCDKYLSLGRNMIPEDVTVWNNRWYSKSLYDIELDTLTAVL